MATVSFYLNLKFIGDYPSATFYLPITTSGAPSRFVAGLVYGERKWKFKQKASLVCQSVARKIGFFVGFFKQTAAATIFFFIGLVALVYSVTQINRICIPIVLALIPVFGSFFIILWQAGVAQSLLLRINRNWVGIIIIHCIMALADFVFSSHN